MLIKKNRLKEEVTKNPNSATNSANTKDNIPSQAEEELIEKNEWKEAKKVLEVEKKEFEKERKKFEKERAESTKEFEKAQQEGFKLLEELEKQLLNEIASIKKVKESIVSESKPVLFELAMNLTEKVINKQVKEDSRILESMIRQAMDEMNINSNQSVKLTLRVNSLDLEAAEKYALYLSNKSSGQLDIKVLGKDDIAQGSCFLEGVAGSVDLNFSSQLKLFRQKMNL